MLEYVHSSIFLKPIELEIPSFLLQTRSSNALKISQEIHENLFSMV